MFWEMAQQVRFPALCWPAQPHLSHQSTHHFPHRQTITPYIYSSIRDILRAFFRTFSLIIKRVLHRRRLSKTVALSDISVPDAFSTGVIEFHRSSVRSSTGNVSLSVVFLSDLSAAWISENSPLKVRFLLVVPLEVQQQSLPLKQVGV